MTPEIIWTLSVATAGVVVSVGTYVYSRVSASRASRREARRASIERVLDTVETVARALANPWSRRQADLEFLLLLPRLTANLPTSDRAVSLWLLRRTQLMALSDTDSEAVIVGAQAGMELSLWVSGARKNKWFEAANEEDPPALDFKVPRQTRFNRRRRQVGSSFALGLLIGVGILSVREILR